MSTTQSDELREAVERELLPPIPKTRRVQCTLPDGRFYWADAEVKVRLNQTKKVCVWANFHGPLRVPFPAPEFRIVRYDEPFHDPAVEVIANERLFMTADRRYVRVWFGHDDRWLKDENGLERVLERRVVYGLEEQA